MSRQEFQQSQKQVQSQIFAPQLRQSLKILQASALELQTTIAEELQTNPTLEDLPLEGSLSVESSLEKPEEGEYEDEFLVLNELDQEWRDHFNQERLLNPYHQDLADRHQHRMESITASTSLQEHLLEQAHLGDFNEKELEILQYLIGSLDSRGFLVAPLEELAETEGLDKELLKSTKNKLQLLEPVGLGSETIQECLFVQLKSQGLENSLAAVILSDYYDLLVRRRIPELAKNLNVTVDDVQEAIEQIGQLNPAPGRLFEDDVNAFVAPDVTFAKEEGVWRVTLNNEYIPRLRISQSYKNMIAQGGLSGKEKDYIRDKIRSGKFIITAIEQRQTTLKRISEKILEVQQDFFNHGPSKLHPLTMNEVGLALGMHETTVSRALAQKYAQTPHGLFPLKYFFTSGYETERGELLAKTSVKDKITEIIKQEPGNKPFSDQKIAELLAQEGMTVARRTIAKYREELGILSTSLRKKY